MEEKFDYSEVPQTYIHCLHTSCPRSGSCLRFQVTRHASPEMALFEVINPAHVVGKEDNCYFFRPNELSRFALGITHLLDNVPHSKATVIKKDLFNSFGRNKFYRIRAKERLITPAEQIFIRNLFWKEDITEEPEFDKYVYQYEWD